MYADLDYNYKVIRASTHFSFTLAVNKNVLTTCKKGSEYNTVALLLYILDIIKSRAVTHMVWIDTLTFTDCL